MTVKEIRAMTGLTQVAFAEKYEIPFRTLQAWELGLRKPAPYISKLLEKAVRYDLEKE